ncbi:MAG: glycosyltransferase family 4 protein [Planctomycetota bacterium]
MRVLLISHGLPPESVGGVEQHVVGLSRALAGLGCAVRILARTSAKDRRQGDWFEEEGGNPSRTRIAYRWEGLQGIGDLYSVRAIDEGFGNFLADCEERGEPFDVAHIHHLTGLSVGVAETLRARGTKVALTLHDYWLACPRGQMFHRDETACERFEPARCGECLAGTFPWWFRGADAAALARGIHERAAALLCAVDALIVPSERMIAPFADLGIPRERFRPIENGVDAEALRLVRGPSAGPGKLRIGFLGTLLPSKGLEVLVRAVRRQQPGTVELHVHGNAAPYHGDSGYLTRVFQSLAPGDAVHYHGPYAPADLPRILSGIDVLAAPALWREAFGLTVREGLAAGRPALVSRIGGLQDSVRDGVDGLLLPPGDEDAWARAIADLAGDRERVRRMGAAGRGRARGFPEMASDLLEIYRGLCGA